MDNVNIYYDKDKVEIKYLLVETSYFKLPLDFNGSVGDAVILLGEYMNQERPDMNNDLKADTRYEEEDISLKDYRAMKWKDFTKMYAEGDDRRCAFGGGLYHVHDGQQHLIGRTKPIEEFKP